MNTPEVMHAMVLVKPRQALIAQELPVPLPTDSQLLIKITACGVCRTDLHIVDGELPSPKLPLIPGHEVIGHVIAMGKQVSGFSLNDLVGVPWLGYTCGHCKFCLLGKENLCDYARFTGYTLDGGYAEYMVADGRFCIPLDKQFADAASAPLLCAGLIGFRSYQMIDARAQNIGIYGFGAAAHIITPIARAQGKNIFAFTRDGDLEGQSFAREMGAYWAGGSSESLSEKLDAAIILAPVGYLVPKALKDVDKGGTVICGGIHMSTIPAFEYELLWGERIIRSVANLTRQDGTAFFELLKHIPIHTQTNLFSLQEANQALDQLKKGNIQGAAVLVME